MSMFIFLDEGTSTTTGGEVVDVELIEPYSINITEDTVQDVSIDDTDFNVKVVTKTTKIIKE